MADLTGRKPILCLDFDGVCHSYTSGWKGADVIPDPPVTGMWEFLLEANRHFEINIFSSRSGQEGGIVAMRNWFIDCLVKSHNTSAEMLGTTRPAAEHDGVLVFDDTQTITKEQVAPFIDALLRFPQEKPPAFVGIDDRVITFTGHWPTIAELKNFKPWNQLGVSGEK